MLFPQQVLCQYNVLWLVGQHFCLTFYHIGAGSLAAWHLLHPACSKHSSLPELSIWERGRSREEGRSCSSWYPRTDCLLQKHKGASAIIWKQRPSRVMWPQWLYPGRLLSTCLDVPGDVIHCQCGILVNLSGLRRGERIYWMELWIIFIGVMIILLFLSFESGIYYVSQDWIPIPLHHAPKGRDYRHVPPCSALKYVYYYFPSYEKWLPYIRKEAGFKASHSRRKVNLSLILFRVSSVPLAKL